MQEEYMAYNYIVYGCLVNNGAQYTYKILFLFTINKPTITITYLFNLASSNLFGYYEDQL